MEFLRQTTRTAAGLAKSAAEETGLVDFAKAAIHKPGAGGGRGIQGRGVEGVQGGGVTGQETVLSGSDKEALQAAVLQLQELQARVALLEKERH
jgi:dihydrodipicolinate reductase